MKFDREAALRSAERAVKSGKLDQAIAEYARIVEQQPRDFNSTNTLGDLYFRAGQTDSAVAQYTKIAEHFLEEGFLPKASALFKKILKIRPADEQAMLRLGQIAAKQGLLANARSSMNAVAAMRRARGDAEGADDIVIALADIDTGDTDVRTQAARVLASRGQGADAASRLRELALDLLEKERHDEAIDVLRETVHLVPDDRLARKQLIGLLNDLGQGAEAEVYVTRDIAADDPAMLLMVAKAELQSGRLDEGREDIRAALTPGPAAEDVLAFMQQIAPRLPDAAFIAAEALADAAIGQRQVPQAVEVMSRFLELAPAHVGGALRLVEICLEEGLDQMLVKAQTALADAYIGAGQPESARVIAEDLAAADVSDEDARRRLVRVYAALGFPDPEDQAVVFLDPDAAFRPAPVAPPVETAELDAEPEAPPVEEAEPETLAVEEAEPETLPVEEAEPETLAVEEAEPETLPVEEPEPETLAVEEPEPETLPVEEAEPETLALEEAEAEVPVQEAEPETLAVETAEPETLPVQEPEPETLPVQDEQPEAVLTPQDALPDRPAVDPDADFELPEFDVYVYDQPSPPLESAALAEPVEPEPQERRTEPVEPEEPEEPAEPGEPAEPEETLIARLIAEETSRQAPKPLPAQPEIDLTSTLDTLDQEPSAAEAMVPPLEDIFDGFRERDRAEEHKRAEAAFEEAELAGALRQINDAERLYAEAARSPRFRFRAASALARLLRDEGRTTEAIEWLERASEVPAPDREAGFALMFELADLLEGHGESMRALAIFMELHAEAGDYRGIAARVERLARAEIGG